MAVNVRAPHLLVRAAADLLRARRRLGGEHPRPVGLPALDRAPGARRVQGGAGPPHPDSGPGARAGRARERRGPGSRAAPGGLRRRRRSRRSGAWRRWESWAPPRTWCERCSSWRSAGYVTGQILAVDGGDSWGRPNHDTGIAGVGHRRGRPSPPGPCPAGAALSRRPPLRGRGPRPRHGPATARRPAPPCTPCRRRRWPACSSRP